jgi:CDGSH iron-sulfur domain-containing protein 3
MSKPEIAAKNPFAVDVEKGKDYWWCACGKSKSQPFCDGSHKGSEFNPVKYTADESKTVYFCGCKHSGKGALCDGTHKSL